NTPVLRYDMDQESVNVYRGCMPVVDAEYEFESDGSPIVVIAEALAEAAEIDPVDLPPLYEFVDPDALDQLFGDHDGAAHADALLNFRVETWYVFIRADGRIRVCDATQPTDPEPVFESTPA
ncbi:HalOD1 output domain-containing protein, partial [Natrinema sp. H-ect4]|uniref:HalOD1 output domain-containing protein n=1 Tax=Natrinema sp. H-ect4 TaxID=3242699 RepID=UPI0035A94E16